MGLPTVKNELNTYLTCQQNTINPSVTCSLARFVIELPCFRRSTDALCKWSDSIADLTFPFTLPVFVLLGLFLGKMAQCINKYIHKNTPNIYEEDEEDLKKKKSIT